MNSYLVLKKKHQKEFEDFPMEFAFSDKQFEEAMTKLGLTPKDTDKVYKFGDTGGIYRRSDSEALFAMLKRHNEEIEQAIKNDLTGDGFVFDMFNYELANHEYTYTWDVTDTLDALGLTIEQVQSDKKLSYALNKACEAQARKEEY